MENARKKAAVAAYKEQKTVAGIYAVRCAAAGRAWIGTAPNLETIQNRLWFGLRLGSSPHRALQAAWNEHGAEALSFDVLERFDGESGAPEGAALKNRLSSWQEKLGADAL